MFHFGHFSCHRNQQHHQQTAVLFLFQMTNQLRKCCFLRSLKLILINIAHNRLRDVSGVSQSGNSSVKNLRVNPRPAVWKKMKRCTFSELSLRKQSQNCCENICQLLWTLRGLFDGFHINQTRRPATIIFSTHNFCSHTLKDMASGLYIFLIKKSNCLMTIKEASSFCLCYIEEENCLKSRKELN